MDIRKANTLDEALSSYFSREQLDNNDYKCEACKRRVPATKQFTLERPPKVLCVQLKRFSVLGGKISRHIGFKQTIDMGPYLWREPGESPRQLTYKLMSMVTHMGPSVNCGHYTAVAQVSSGQYYSFDDACVRPVSLNNVLSTNAYIMIFEMDSHSQNQQTAKVNGTTSAKIVSTSLSSFANKSPASKASTSAGCSANGSSSELASNNDNSGGTLIGPQLPAVRSVELKLPIQNCTDNVSAQSSQKTSDKPKLVSLKKSSNENKLVPYDYDGLSEEEDSCSFGTSKNQVSSNAVSRVNSANLTNGVPKCPVGKDASKISNFKETQKVNPKSNTNSISTTTQATTMQYAKPQNGSNNNSRMSLLKHQANGKAETSGQMERDKDMWHQSIRIRNEPDEKVPTKVTSSIKGWQVSKDISSPACIGAVNGWSVTDNRQAIFSIFTYIIYILNFTCEFYSLQGRI